MSWRRMLGVTITPLFTREEMASIFGWGASGDSDTLHSLAAGGETVDTLRTSIVIFVDGPRAANCSAGHLCVSQNSTAAARPAFEGQELSKTPQPDQGSVQILICEDNVG